ncbi:MAG: Glycosyltransferase [Rhodobacteraceae bacterium HLUCCO18]|nr:MAG: Glycosyltransferase [Rhodobacteraceae bacterium HLUCCO18]
MPRNDPSHRDQFKSNAEKNVLRILHLVSVADSQSIPLELALSLRKREPGTVIAGFYAQGDHPVDHDRREVMILAAKGPFDIAAIARLRSLMASHSPDIVHLHHAVSAFWCALVALTVRPVPILVKTEHNDHRGQSWHQGAVNLILYPFLRAIVCNSDATLSSFSRIERWLAGRRALRIHNGLNLRQVRSKAARTMRKDHVIRMGHVGRLVSQKNQARMIKGLAIARAVTGRDLRLEIVGNGPLMDDLVRTARAAGVANAVVFTGALTREAVYEKLGQWDAFVMPSKFEGFCNALIEAMAAGLPVAVSDIDTLREVAGEGALRFDPYDPQAIGAAMVALVGLPRRSTRFVERYDMAHAVARHVALYEALLAGRSPSVTARLPLVGKDVPGE